MRKTVVLTLIIASLVLNSSVVQAQEGAKKAYQNAIDYLKYDKFEDSLYWFNLVIEEDPTSFLANKARIHWLTIKSGIMQGLTLLALSYLQGQQKAIRDANKFAEKTKKDYWNNQIESLKKNFSHLFEFSRKLSSWEESIQTEKIKLDYVYTNSEIVAKFNSLRERIESGNEFLWVSFNEAEKAFIKFGVMLNYYAITGCKDEFCKPSFESKVDPSEFWFTMGLGEFNVASAIYLIAERSSLIPFGYKRLEISTRECLPYLKQALRCFEKVLALTEQDPYSRTRYETQKKIRELKNSIPELAEEN